MTENAFTTRRCALLASICVAMAAATTPSLAAQPTPGTVQDTIQQEPPQVPLPMDVAPEFEKDVDPEMQQPVGPRVTVDRFTVIGNQSIDDATLQAALQPYVGKPLSLSDIYEAADLLTALYRKRGFGLANVLVPAQKISDGEVRLEVIEGRIGAVSVTGNELYSFNFLNDRLAGLEPGTIYRSDEMERGILLLNDLPGLQARAVIKPGEEYGSSDLLFKVTEDVADFSGSLDNYGREGLGEIRLSATANFNSLTGRGDRLSITGLVSEGGALTYGNLTYGIPLGADGDRLRFTYNQADYEVDEGEFALLGVTGDNTTYRVDWSSPLVRSRDYNVVFTTALYRQETESFIAGAALPENSTELNLLELGLFMSGVTESRNSWSFSALLSGNGQSNDSTITDPVTDSQQAKLRVDGSWSMPFARRWLFQTRATAVYSSDPLVDSQKFSLGGPYSVRGYFPAEQRGDHGGFLSLELRRYFLVSKYPIAASVFVDGGYAKNQLLPGETEYPARSGELGSAGVGLLFAPDGSAFSGSLMYAEPIDNHTSLAGDDDGHFWASFKVMF
ncbi:MAG: ShlB/FhaC/HecB family hemolysin secretion/activation protein [Gammaproteobacteria bacterium]|nr:ShlB/FhaC/HecB family hemolysin secretion/activation protein [Gammaproteobacteria bacterium]